MKIRYKQHRGNFAEQIEASGKVTMKQLVALKIVSYPTILRHVALGHLAGEKRLIGRKAVWFFEMADVMAYLPKARDLMKEAVQKERAKAIPPDGWITLRGLANRTGLSLYSLRCHLYNGRLHAGAKGFKRATLISEEEADRFIREVIGNIPKRTYLKKLPHVAVPQRYRKP